jgi:hypothetical protein
MLNIKWGKASYLRPFRVGNITGLFLSFWNLYGSHPLSLFTKQTTLIQSNTTQVYFNLIVTLTCAVLD